MGMLLCGSIPTKFLIGRVRALYVRRKPFVPQPCGARLLILTASFFLFPAEPLALGSPEMAVYSSQIAAQRSGCDLERRNRRNG